MSAPLVDVTGARRRRARARLRRQLTTAAVGVGVLAVIAGVAWVVFGSPWLRIATVEVHGNAVTTPDQVVAASGVPVGEPLATLDVTTAARRVTDALPPVASAQVRQEWPSTVVIEVTERVPVLAVPSGDGFEWVAADGVSFAHAPDAPRGVLRAGGNLGNPEVVAALGRVAAALPGEVREKADSVTAETPDSVEVVLADGRRILWGGAEDGDLKARVLSPLLSVKAKVYDVSAPTHPTTR